MGTAGSLVDITQRHDLFSIRGNPELSLAAI